LSEHPHDDGCTKVFCEADVDPRPQREALLVIYRGQIPSISIYVDSKFWQLCFLGVSYIKLIVRSDIAILNSLQPKAPREANPFARICTPKMSSRERDDSISEKSDGNTHTENANNPIEGSSKQYKQNPKGNDKDNVAAMQALTRKLENPLYDIEKSDLIRQAEEFADKHGLSEDKELFVKGAILAQNPKKFHELEELSDEDKASLQHEM